MGSIIGRWGDLIFTVDSLRQLPFKDMQRKVGARWKTHNIFGEKPRTEFLGAEQTEVSMKITFSAHHGRAIRPRRSIQNLQEACLKGQLEYLYVGAERIGKGKHYIESIDTDWEEVWNKGELVRATCKITFKEAR